MANRWGNSGKSGWLYFSGLQNHCRWWLQPWNWKTLTPWKESYDQLSILKSRDITLSTNVHIVKPMVFPVVTYGCESWTINKSECRRRELWCWQRLLRVLWTTRRSNQSILMKISPGGSLEGLMLKLKLQYFGHLMWKADSLEKPWCWERLRAGGKGDDGGWDGWMASPTQWTWVWVDSRRWWWTGRPGVLRFMGLQRVRHELATELNWTDSNVDLLKQKVLNL